MDKYSNLIFSSPRFTDKPSAWIEHVPFAFFLIDRLQPDVFVELGTHYGISYFAFCQAISESALTTRAWAVDSWLGDDQAGYYDQEVFGYVDRINSENFGSFSRLLRMTFDQARDQFDDGTVDLLHIDGMHDYETVKHDFEGWLPKMSSRGVMVFHDSNVPDPAYGVDKLMKEIDGIYPQLGFKHGFGLTVIATGRDVNSDFLSFMAEAKENEFALNLFAHLGGRLLEHKKNERLLSELKDHLDLVVSAAEQIASKDQLIRKLQAEPAHAEVKSKIPAIALPAFLKIRKRTKPVTLFDEQFYLKNNPDVAASGMNPLKHYLKYGIAEGRRGWESDESKKELISEYPEVVLVTGESRSPGHQYRIVNYRDAYAGLGIKAIISDPESLAANLTVLNGARIVVIWRMQYGSAFKAIVDYARNKGIAVIYDIDDYMFDPALAEPELIDAIRSQGYTTTEVKMHYALVRAAMHHADFCTCSTQELANAITSQGMKAFVLPNGYSNAVLDRSEFLYRKKLSGGRNIRIGYAGGTLTHQKDLQIALPAILQVMKEFPETILTVFRDTVLLSEFPGLLQYSDRVEVRDLVPFDRMQDEISRFDINIAPLEDSLFCHAKSELKYFEAALLRIPTIASASPPFRDAIASGYNGFLAQTADEWVDFLRLLVSDPSCRHTTGLNAYHSVLWNFGPEQRVNLLFGFLRRIRMQNLLSINHAETREKAQRFQELLGAHQELSAHQYPKISEFEIVAEFDHGGFSEVGIVIPLYNYEGYVLSALESVKAQSLADLDLVVVDDGSSDRSAELVKTWMATNHGRFNHCTLLRHRVNCGLGATRNTGFNFIRTHYVFPLDADNELLPGCLELCLPVIRNTGAAIVFPQLLLFGEDTSLISRNFENTILGNRSWDPEQLALTNYIDAMALVSRACWAKAGGYAAGMKYGGLEDYDLWLRFVELGFFGINIPSVLARYRVHSESMLHTVMAGMDNERNLELAAQHPSMAAYRKIISKENPEIHDINRRI